MKRPLVLTALLIAFLAHTNANLYSDNTALNVVPFEEYEEIKELRKKKPKLPSQKQFKASVLEIKTASLDSEAEFEKLLMEIDSVITRPVISSEDIDRGWYLGGNQEKKIGTPDLWSWTSYGGVDRWISPEAIDELLHASKDNICEHTGGSYARSCLETESNCEYIPTTQCVCPAGTLWTEKEGCLLADEEGVFVEITKAELSRGWYTGEISEKKKNTPAHWFFNSEAKTPRWQNPTQ